MQIHLHPEIFDQVANGIKTVEARVNDEKRQQLRVGDIITILKRPDEIDTLQVKVTGLHTFSNFTELANNYTIEQLYSPNYTKKQYLALFPQFYSDEEITKYGAVAIEFELVWWLYFLRFELTELMRVIFVVGSVAASQAIVMDPTKFPRAHNRIVQLQFMAAPAVITLAMLCWKPAKMNNGTPINTPQIEPSL